MDRIENNKIITNKISNKNLNINNKILIYFKIVVIIIKKLI